MKISKDQFDKLYSENISKKEYDKIIELIDERSSDIVLLIYPKITKNGFFVYGNYHYEDENSEGFFDIEKYKNEIEYGGQFSPFGPYFDYDSGFIPTRWLWTDDNEILKEFTQETEKFKNNILKEKELKKQKRNELKLQKIKFKEIIKSKLSKEELKYIKFK